MKSMLEWCGKSRLLATMAMKCSAGANPKTKSFLEDNNFNSVTITLGS